MTAYIASKHQVFFIWIFKKKLASFDLKDWKENVIVFNIYLFGCARAQLHMWNLWPSCGLWDLVSWPQTEPRPPALGIRGDLSHWTAREALVIVFKMHKIWIYFHQKIWIMINTRIKKISSFVSSEKYFFSKKFQNGLLQLCVCACVCVCLTGRTLKRGAQGNGPSCWV